MKILKDAVWHKLFIGFVARRQFQSNIKGWSCVSVFKEKIQKLEVALNINVYYSTSVNIEFV